ncbi:M48 family metallopeptidase [Chloroflexota bacterium]
MMTNSRTIEIAGVGPVFFERSKRARRISISVRPFKGVRVAVPVGTSYKSAEEFALSKTDWLIKHISIFRNYEKETGSVRGNGPVVDRSAARQKLAGRLEYLAGKHGFVYNRVFFRNQKTRWGSCSFTDNISLNIQLVHLPEELVDYVLLHELVHTRVKNHSPSFWQELDRYTGDAKGMAKKLKKYGLGLY